VEFLAALREGLSDGRVVCGQVGQLVEHLTLPDDRVHQVTVAWQTNSALSRVATSYTTHAG